MAVSLRDVFKRTFRCLAAWQDGKCSMAQTHRHCDTHLLSQWLTEHIHHTREESVRLLGLQHEQGGSSSPRISIRREKHPQQFPFLMELRCWTETQIRLYTKRARSGHEKGICPSLWEVVTSCLLEQAWILSSNLVPFPRLLHALQFA